MALQPKIHLLISEIRSADDPACLTTPEKKRYDRFLVPLRKQQFLRGRILIKKWLKKNYPNHLTHGFSFHSKSTHQPPKLYYKNKIFPHLSLSIAHKKKWVVLAVGVGCRVGVDLEEKHPTYPKKMTHFLCSPEEKKRLSALKPQPLQKKLTELWTIKEAALKMLGLGVWNRPSTLETKWRSRIITNPQGEIFVWKTFKKDLKVITLVTELKAKLSLPVTLKG